MGLFTLLSGLYGCGKPGNNPDYIDDGEVGDDYSEGGRGEYLKVTGFSFGISGYGPGYTYSVHKSDEDENITILEYENYGNSIREVSGEIDAKILEQVSELAAELNIRSWDKFSKSNRNVLDGEGFSLTMEFEDGTRISAHGDNSFPKNYSEFCSGINEILKPAVDSIMAAKREEMFEEGLYNGPLDTLMVYYKDRGASGNDEYNFYIYRRDEGGYKVDSTVVSVSGDFIEPGEYRYYGEVENLDELFEEVQAVLEKYYVYTWDGYDESTPDYYDREWFQLSFSYPEAGISCMGCGDTDNYEEVRQELLETLTAGLKDYFYAQ